jgi:hypothetical protein
MNIDIQRRKLKIKENSLSTEQKHIRREELKHKWKMRALRGKQKVKMAEAAAKGAGYFEYPYETNTYELRSHRLGLRKEIRSTHLARGFLRGTPYFMAEPFSYTQPDWNRIQTLIERYSGEDRSVVIQRYAQWLQEALRGVDPFLTDGHHGSDKRTPGSGRDKVWIAAQDRELNAAE